MIDLNTGSGANLGPRTFGDDVNDVIDAGILARRGREPKRTYLGASLLGHPCDRYLAYDYAHVPPDEELTAAKIRIFDIGHAMEDFVAEQMGAGEDQVFKDAAARWFIDAGFDLRVKDSTGKQFGWEAIEGKMKGHVDGAFVSGPALLNRWGISYPALWETKALNNKSWNQIKKHGLKIGNERYYGQCSVNMGYMSVWHTIFTACNKNTQQMHHELIEFDPARAQLLSDRGLNTIRSHEAGALPPRCTNNRDFHICKKCDRRVGCWSDPR